MAAAAVQPASLLPDLAATANREYGLAEQALGSALEHIIRCGEALTEIRDTYPHGWTAWVEDNFHGSAVTASYYMRIATYKDLVREHRTLSDAMKALRGLPPVRRPGPRGYPEEVRQAAVALVEAGETETTVARLLGVSQPTVVAWSDPDVAEMRRRAMALRNAARRERRREEKEETRKREARKLAQRAGGGVAEAYSLAERISKPLAEAERAATTPEAKAALTEARYAYHRMRDQIVCALGAWDA